MPKKGNHAKSAGLNTKQRKEVKTLIEGEQEYKQHIHLETGVIPQTDEDLVDRVDYLAGILQGTGDEQRVGDKVKLKFMRFKYKLECEQSNEMIRVMLVQWKETDSSLIRPTAGTFLEDAKATNKAGLLSTARRDLQDQFTVLYDKVHMMDKQGGSQTPSQVVRDIKVNLKYAKRNVAYLTGSDYGSNKIFPFIFSELPPDTNTSPPTQSKATTWAQFVYSDS